MIKPKLLANVISFFVLLVLSGAIAAYAGNNSDRFQAVQDCAAKLGIRLELGNMPSESDRKQIDACLGSNSADRADLADDNRGDFFQAVQQCAQELGIEIRPGRFPSAEEKEKIDACLEKKGIKPPKGLPPFPG